MKKILRSIKEVLFLKQLEKEARKGNIGAILLFTVTATDYIPKKNADFDEWQTNFVTEATALLSTWGISPTLPAWVAVTDNEAIWNPAWAVANPFLANRTHPLVTDMQTARKNYAKALRYFIQNYLAKNNDVTPEQRATVGITIPLTTKTYHPVPEDRAPNGVIHKMGFLWQELRITDPDNPTTKRKPVGVKRNLVFMVITDQGVFPSMDDFAMVGSTSTYKFIASFSGSQKGKVAHYYTKWEDSRQRKGQPSRIFSETII